MKTVIGEFLIVLDIDTIMIKNAKTNELIRAKEVNANDAVDAYRDLIKVLTEKHKKQKNDQDTI
jgi:hypothetical protein